MDTTQTSGTTRFLDRLEGRIAYDVTGTGPLVVMAPGMGDLRSTWRYQVPVLVAAGYRVSERSPFGDYAIVRERDAHAWVEAWIDDGWETFDPTPPGSLGGESVTPVGSAMVDYLRTQWERADDWLAKYPPARRR